ncbi:DnaJ domain-containing protein [Psychrobacillus sp. NPDC093180]|uniref:J domain-containing protein n=1 Tax=Psychrobacillus sp. NPDC093180 TaxID=3364489 RepID=UPI00381FFED7
MVTNLGPNYYEILEIDMNASNLDIKKAYFTKIREYPNESYPEQFQLLSKAYKVLMDAEKKKKYDQELNDDGTYNRMLSMADDYLDKNLPQKALNILDELILVYSGDFTIQQNRAYCLMKLEKFEEANILLLSLEKTYPNDEVLLELLGQNYLNLKMYNPATHYYERLVKLNSNNLNYVLNIARIYITQEKYDLAIKVIEEKLAEKEENVRDFPLLEELYFLTIINDDYSYHTDVVHRIKKLYKSDVDKDILLNMLITLCENLDTTNNAFKELIKIIKDINGYENTNISDWVINAEKHIRKDLIYYGDHGNHSNKNKTPLESQTNETNSDRKMNRGSIAFSIIFAIIASFIFNPIIGVIVGVIWYFNAGFIKNIIGCLGCIGVIVFVIGIISML